jgi:hypothetical protein
MTCGRPPGVLAVQAATALQWPRDDADAGTPVL